MSSINNNNSNNNVCVNSSPPWEVLALVSYHLDPKTLAKASCVSKSWLSCFSSDYLWGPLCSVQFPSLSTLLQTNINVPRRRLFAIGYSAARLRDRLPRKPTLSLDNLLFAITIKIPCNKNSSSSGHVTINVIRPCKELKRDPHGSFRFDVDVDDDMEWGVDELEGVRVTWNIIDSEWKAVFAMAEDSGAKKGGFSSSSDGWFSEELPTPWCCSGGMSSGLVADLRVEMVSLMGVGLVENGGCRSVIRSDFGNKMRIRRVKVGVMCIINWRYLSVDDALSYLDHFLKV